MGGTQLLGGGNIELMGGSQPVPPTRENPVGWGGVLARFYGSGGEGFELLFARVVGNSPIKKLPRGMVRLGID